jgi:hypothetical protein
MGSYCSVSKSHTLLFKRAEANLALQHEHTSLCGTLFYDGHHFGWEGEYGGGVGVCV